MTPRIAPPKGSGLRRQIILSMAAVATSVVLLVILGSYAFYAYFYTYFPSSISDDIVPNPVEIIWMASTLLAALILATGVAVKLARRILAPLNSVAASLRRVAEGDLSARASMEGSPMGEATRLVLDFNNLAEQMESMAKDRAFWNAAIAHELRTPVTVLRGRLQGMTEGVFQPTPALLVGLLSQVEGLARLVEDLRVLGLGESGRLDIQLEQCDLAASLRDAVGTLEPNLRSVGLVPVLEMDTDEVVCDPVRIRQALMALLDNAINHAESGPLHIRSFRRHGLYHLQVEDAGPGIPVALRESVFDAFHRGQKSRSGQGSGLGLAVVRAIARAHGGDVHCLPSGQGGTIFDLTLPG